MEEAASEAATALAKLYMRQHRAATVNAAMAMARTSTFQFYFFLPINVALIFNSNYTQFYLFAYMSKSADVPQHSFHASPQVYIYLFKFIYIHIYVH